MTLKKSTKRFTISTEAENIKDFSVRTEGIDLSAYVLNPLMLWMHQRPKGVSRDEILPLGNFLDLEINDGKLSGVPAFDTTDTFAVSIMNKVENGTLRMASAGLVPIEWRNLDGKVWLWRSKMVEISLADIGCNPEALAVALYDENENLITLSQDFLTQISNNMKLIQLSADAVLPIIGLAADAKPEEVQAKIQELVTLADTQKTTIDTLTTEKSEAEQKVTEVQEKLDTQIKLASEAKITALVDGAVTARKITADQKAHFVKLAATDFDTTKAILDGIASAPSVKEQVNQSKADNSSQYEKLSWSEMDKSGVLIQLKAENFDLFKAKYKEKFKKDYPG
ncbi:phage protease [Litoribacter populi]|uniref:phage protease n=1 Tax=Litoribacter populi TaxID=2598460 RepID=UPI00117EE8EC|nr:phage protease [Litoribacter populi]